MEDAFASAYRELFYGMFYPAQGNGAAVTSTVVSDVAYQGALGAVRKALQDDDQKEFGANSGGN